MSLLVPKLLFVPRPPWWLFKHEVGQATVRKDPKYLIALCQQPNITSAWDVKKFECASRWCADQAPRFSSAVQPLRDFLRGNGVSQRELKNHKLHTVPQEVSEAVENIRQCLSEQLPISMWRSDFITVGFSDAPTISSQTSGASSIRLRAPKVDSLSRQRPALFSGSSLAMN